MIRSAALLLSALFLTGPAPQAQATDQSQPWSRIRLPITRASDPHEYRVTMLMIDGKNAFVEDSEFDLAPGPHEFRISTTKPALGPQLRDASQRVYTLEMRPCMSYELVAVHPLSIHNREWTPTLKSEKSIAHCAEKFAIEPAAATP